jgi:phosphonopyruvate decarboxylase
MISSANFVQALTDNGVYFFTGVPDSLLKSFCAHISGQFDEHNHIIAANEGNAVGIAIGYHLATGKIPLVYMQNSGLGNAVNPMLSLADPEVYGIPLIVLIGWRGKPGKKDEPQHIKQGRVMLNMLTAMEIPTFFLGDTGDSMRSATDEAIGVAKNDNCPVALIAEKGCFEPERANIHKTVFPLLREEAIIQITKCLPSNAAVVSTTGMTSRELFESRVRGGSGHMRDFLTVGGMGHASQIALGIALRNKERAIVCIDGDGAALMHLGGLAIVGQSSAENYIHILLNNGAHASVGGQPTVGLRITPTVIAEACGFRTSQSADSLENLVRYIGNALASPGPHFIEIRVRQGHRSDLGRPTRTPIENKLDFSNFLRNRD